MDSVGFTFVRNKAPSRSAKSALKPQRSETVSGSKSSEKMSSPGVHIKELGAAEFWAVAIAEIAERQSRSWSIIVAFIVAFRSGWMLKIVFGFLLSMACENHFPFGYLNVRFSIAPEN